MPSGTFIVQNTTVPDFRSWLGFLIENTGWQVKEQICEGDETVIKAVTRGKLEAWMWHRFVPFGKWMKRGQRVGIEAHLKPCAYGVLLEEIWEELMNAMKQRYKLTSTENARFIPDAYLKCPKCGWLNPLTANHCKNCGAKLKSKN